MEEAVNCPQFPVIAIECIDWIGGDDQISVDELKTLKPLAAWIVGQLVSEDKDCVRLCMTHFYKNTGKNIREYICVSKKTIRHRINLTKGAK
jgi:hypothetical protein